MQTHFEIGCSNLNCPAGEFTDFDLKTKDYSCRKCPLDTFSEGNDIDIQSAKKDWNNKLIKDKMIFGCYSFNQQDKVEPVENANCSNFSPSGDGSSLVNGKTDVVGNSYEGVLSLFADVYDDTAMELSYELKVKQDWFSTNGGMLIVNNYESVLNSYKSTNGKITSYSVNKLKLLFQKGKTT